jgi:hypothetical protein
MNFDLENIIKDSSIILKSSDIKSYMKMLLEGVKYCHENWILHRDIKPGKKEEYIYIYIFKKIMFIFCYINKYERKL